MAEEERKENDIQAEAQPRRRLPCYIDHIYRPAQEPVGYCWNATHYGMLSKSLIEKHGCIKKECKYLEKYMDTAEDYWGNKAKRAEEKKKNNGKKKVKKEIKRLFLERKISFKQYLEWSQLAEEELLKRKRTLDKEMG